MKRIITALAMLACIPAQASLPCPILGDLAYITMYTRQKGVAMSKMMAANGMTDITRAMVSQAFESPRYRNEPSIVREAQDFQASWEKACYDGLPKPK